MSHPTNPRAAFLHSNKYQRRILWPTVLSTLTFCSIVSMMIFYFHRQLIDIILTAGEAPDVETVNRWSGNLLLCLWGASMIFIVWACVVASTLVGAFERILRELDVIIEGRERGQIKARPKDELAQELLKRINFLLEHVRWPVSIGGDHPPPGRF